MVESLVSDNEICWSFRCILVVGFGKKLLSANDKGILRKSVIYTMPNIIDFSYIQALSYCVSHIVSQEHTSLFVR